MRAFTLDEQYAVIGAVRTAQEFLVLAITDESYRRDVADRLAMERAIECLDIVRQVTRAAINEQPSIVDSSGHTVYTASVASEPRMTKVGDRWITLQDSNKT